MVWMDQSDHSTILDTYYRYGRVDAIYSSDDTVDITILDGDGNPTSERYFAVPVFIHCEPDAEQRANGALKDGSSVFDEADTAVVKFEGGSPLVVARRDGLAPCHAKHGGSFISGGAINLFEVQGDPYDGDLHFGSPISWGAADHVWFLGKAYWVLAGGVVKYNADNGWHSPRNINNEVTCTGLPADINEFSITKPGDDYHMRATRDDAAYIYEYVSADGINWSAGDAIGFDLGVTTVAGEPLPLSPAPGWVEFDTDRFFVEHKHKDEHEQGYPDNYFRMYRIGIQERWDEYGELNTIERGWTMIAGSESQSAYHFANENDFTMEGGVTGWQILQIW